MEIPKISEGRFSKVETTTNQLVERQQTEIALTTATAKTLTPAESYNTVVYAIHAASVLTLPPVEAGMKITCIVPNATGGLTITPNASDLIILKGVAQADGEIIIHDGTTGGKVTLTAYDSTGWYADPVGTTFTAS